MHDLRKSLQFVYSFIVNSTLKYLNHKFMNNSNRWYPFSMVHELSFMFKGALYTKGETVSRNLSEREGKI